MNVLASIFLFSLLSLSLLYSVKAKEVSAWGDKYHVHIVNGLPDNTNLLTIHVFSGDDDLGFHDLHVNDDYEWHFRTVLPGVTEFFGHFWWAGKEGGFSVYNDDLAYDHCQTYVCYWLVKPDGFYIANKTNPNDLELSKLYLWN
ncbi:hypothetical protein ACH5RR_018792 [Cinchona calisaya]|uniref:S-protein homolog n=1 Tax=Cinchona calisaya TaxID=153742 RepID=A0ABD2ZNQ6_9GENT